MHNLLSDTYQVGNNGIVVLVNMAARLAQDATNEHTTTASTITTTNHATTL
jgi:hypothetical protein